MDVASAHADPRAVELLGRDVELARLYGLIDSIDQRGGALVVRGEAGIGKSALLAAASERALQRGVTVESTTGALSEAPARLRGPSSAAAPAARSTRSPSRPAATCTRDGVRDCRGRRSRPVPDRPRDAGAGRRPGGRHAASLRGRGRPLAGPAFRRSARSSSRGGSNRIRQSCSSAVREGVPSSFDDADLPELPLAGLDEDASNALLDLAATGCGPISGAGSSRRRPATRSP